MSLLSQFKLGAANGNIRAVDIASRDFDERASPSPARALGKSLVSAFAARGSAAVATDSWTEF